MLFYLSTSFKVQYKYRKVGCIIIFRIVSLGTKKRIDNGRNGIKFLFLYWIFSGKWHKKENKYGNKA